jgi:ABC-2 type transport system permease protein
LGGVFYSIQLLPPFWQVVSGLNPIFYMVNTFRYGILGTSDVDIYWAFLILGVFITVLYSSCILLLRRGTGIRS